MKADPGSADAARTTVDAESARGLPPAAWMVALSSLPAMGPRRLAALLAGRSPAGAWWLVSEGRVLDDPGVAAVLDPRAGETVRRWAHVASRRDVSELWLAHREAGVDVLLRGQPGYPQVFSDDPEPPLVLFSRGDPASLDGPRVAIVGTRRCTRYGRDVAVELGCDLAAAGVRIVSGLAIGIDAAAHAGALAAEEAPPLGVVGNGLDVVYPSRHRELYTRVVERGLLLSEYPLGTAPKAWTFPARNRLVAALADLVVVVESHERGGSLYTVDEAVRRGRDVFVVPGSVRSPASAGTNRLLTEGLAPVRDAGDVLVRLGLMSGTNRPCDGRPSPSDGDRRLLDAVGWEPASLEHLVLRSGIPLGELVERLDRLEQHGWVVRRGGWVEQVGGTGPAR